MSIRERRWKTSKGEARRAWILDYFDRDGVRRQETFERSGDAKAREAEITVDLRKGVQRSLRSALRGLSTSRSRG
jgi:integrase